MKNKRFIAAYDSIPMDSDMQERIWEMLQDAADGRRTLRIRRNHRRMWRTLLIAAAIAAVMGITAYATDFLGLRALKIEGQKPQMYCEESHEWIDNPEGAIMSMSQPQEAPAEADNATQIEKLLIASANAWEEWQNWKAQERLSALQLPEVEGANVMTTEVREDGGATFRFYAMPEAPEELDTAERITWNWENSDWIHDEANWSFLKEVSLSAEEYAALSAWQASQSSPPLEGYDGNYGVINAEQAEKLEDIAAKYGLELRRQRHEYYGNSADYYAIHGRPDWMTDELYEQELNDSFGTPQSELYRALNEALGPFFAEQPAYIEKFYYFDEGSFGLSFNVVFPNGRIADCYLYNSVYRTLSSGNELLEEIESVTDYLTENYAAQDGTVWTLLHNQNAAFFEKDYAYVYLPDSFLTISLHCHEGLSVEDAHGVLDMLRASVLENGGDDA